MNDHARHLLGAALGVYGVLALGSAWWASYQEAAYWDALDRGTVSIATPPATSPPASVRESMALLARKGRESFPVIRPSEGHRAPLTGWAHGPDRRVRAQAAEAFERAERARSTPALAGEGQRP